MKTIISLITVFVITSSLQAQSQDSIELEAFKKLSKKEIYQQYAYDDTSKALIKMHYWANTRASVLGTLCMGTAFGTGAASYAMFNYYDTEMTGQDWPIAMVLFPLFITTTTISVLSATGGIVLLTTFQSKKRLYESLNYYKDKKQLQEQDRKWIKGFLKKKMRTS